MDNVDETKVQDQSDQVEKDTEQPEAEKEVTVTKQIEKMRKRIDKEVGQRKESEDRAKKLEEQVKTLTEKLNSKVPTEEKSKNPELDKAMSENEKLKAQLIRRDQMDTVAQQFSEAGVNVPKDVLNLIVPAGIDEKQVSANMRALSSFYDSIVKSVKKEFMSGPTPRTTGSDEKPFDMAEIRKIKDPVKRLKLIKEHLDQF